jgi:HD superfamily phosphohydrolase
MSSEIAANPLQNAKHEAVLQHYFADPERVGWRCYQRVYPNSSQRASETAFSRLLKTADFSARLAWLQKAAAADNVMDLNEVLVELSKLGRSNIKRAVLRGDDTDQLVESIDSLPDDAAATVQELTIETYIEGAGEDARRVKRVKVKLHSKHAALAELRRHHEPDKHEHTGAGGGPIETRSEPVSELDLARRIAFALEQGARAPKPAAAPPAPKPKPKPVKTKAKGKKR